MILFLDFDGVLHPDPCDRRERFCRLPLLEDVLRQFPHVEVVISSSWRYDHSLVQLQGYFSQGLCERIVGVTGTHARPIREDWMPEALLPIHHREIECWQWLSHYRTVQTPWLAIDDTPDWFAPGCQNLVVTDASSGLQADQAELLARRLKAAESTG